MSPVTEEIEIESNENIGEKRKRESEERQSERKDFSTKYVGESARSGYERGGEHVDALKRMDETSHLMKHYLLKHKNIKIEEMKYGMKVKTIFRTSIERQVGEAVTIHMEKEKGTALMNSKSEYNRCTLPRISTKGYRESLEEEEIEKLEDSILKEEIKKLRYRKRSEKIEKEMRNIDMKRATLEIQNDNIVKWKERREAQEKQKLKFEEEEEKAKNKLDRLKKCENKRTTLLKKLTEKGIIARKGKDVNWIERKKESWRNYRENSDSTIENSPKKCPPSLEKSPKSPNPPKRPNLPISLNLKQSKINFEKSGQNIEKSGKSDEKSDHLSCSVVGDDHVLDKATAGENGHFISENDHFKDRMKEGELKFGLIIDQILSKRADKVTETKVSPIKLKLKFEGGFTDLKSIQFGTENIRDNGQNLDIENKNLAKKSQNVTSVTPKVKCDPPPRQSETHNLNQKIRGITQLKKNSSNGEDLQTDSVTNTGSVTATTLDHKKVIYLDSGKKVTNRRTGSKTVVGLGCPKNSDKDSGRKAKNSKVTPSIRMKSLIELFGQISDSKLDPKKGVQSESSPIPNNHDDDNQDKVIVDSASDDFESRSQRHLDLKSKNLSANALNIVKLVNNCKGSPVKSSLSKFKRNNNKKSDSKDCKALSQLKKQNRASKTNKSVSQSEISIMYDKLMQKRNAKLKNANVDKIENENDKNDKETKNDEKINNIDEKDRDMLMKFDEKGKLVPAIKPPIVKPEVTDQISLLNLPILKPKLIADKACNIELSNSNINSKIELFEHKSKISVNSDQKETKKLVKSGPKSIPTCIDSLPDRSNVTPVVGTPTPRNVSISRTVRTRERRKLSEKTRRESPKISSPLIQSKIDLRTEISCTDSPGKRKHSSENSSDESTILRSGKQTKRD